MDETNVVRAGSWTPPVAQLKSTRVRARTDEREYVQACCIDIERAVEQWGDTVLRLARCRCNNAADAEDVVQNVFMKLCQSTKPIKDDEHLKAWLLRVTLTCCADVHRSPWKSRRASEGETAQAFEGAAVDREDVAFCDSEEATTAESVHAAVAALPEKQRVAVHLYYFEDYSTNEIAQITEENPATVRSHLHRARAALKLTMGGTDE
ncbi:RNA polymerase sigma factor [Raoultibacter phocaeensis]|uniref:RNA polymerase sigma factor n=1 Tax=Raoultibacter phocaeensis TaxID=2479841 RepID=UPI001117B1F7|nr:sigma-70 family RNA polymerase sigma factor [Raoultibacter phocaeensis]